MKVDKRVEELVVEWAVMAQECGLSGVVASPQETALIREACGPDFLIVTPGIRPGWAAAVSKRITTPGSSGPGADYMVIGRPIRQAADPRKQPPE